jgi:1-deoxy-D-xylulose-5-phosphate reductoisomerase
VQRITDPARPPAVVVDRAPMRVSIFGATGSVGTSTLDVIEAAPPGTFEVVALTANRNVEALADAARRHGAEIAVIADNARYPELAEALAGTGIQAAAGPAGLMEAANREVRCDTGRGPAGRPPRAREQGMPRDRRRALSGRDALGRH